MRFKPHDYQEQVLDFVYEHPAAALFLDMSLGKTVISLTAIYELMLNRFEISRTLVIGSKRIVRDTWPDELAKWDHLDGLELAVALGTPKQRLAAINSRSHVVAINRENIPWLVKTLGRDWPFDMVIIDESSAFKSHQAQRFKALKAVRSKITRIIALTGTPASNSLLDLWAQFRLLDEGERLGKFIGRYREELFEPDKRNGAQVYSWKPRAGAEDEIYRRIGDITLSMRTADYLTLPPLSYVDVPVKLSEAERGLYDQLKNDLVLQLPGGLVDAANAAVLSSKLIQMASGSVYTDEGSEVIHDRKLEALEDLVESANGKPLMVAYWFKSDQARLLKKFPQARILDTRQDMQDWNAGKIPIALIHPASAGHGLNLQAGGSALVWFTPTWSLELYQQTNARLYRQGQENPVVIYHLVTENSMDGLALKALTRKDVTQSALIDAVKAELHPDVLSTRTNNAYANVRVHNQTRMSAEGE